MTRILTNSAQTSPWTLHRGSIYVLLLPLQHHWLYQEVGLELLAHHLPLTYCSPHLISRVSWRSSRHFHNYISLAFCQTAWVRTNLPYIPNFYMIDRLFSCLERFWASSSRDPCVSKTNRFHDDIFRCCLHKIETCSANYLKWIAKSPKVLNSNHLFLELNWFVCNLAVGSPRP